MQDMAIIVSRGGVMKALTVRIPDDLNERFTRFCDKRGYKKGGLILSLLDRILEEYERQDQTDTTVTTPVYKPIKKDPLAGISRLIGKGGGLFNL